MPVQIGMRQAGGEIRAVYRLDHVDRAGEIRNRRAAPEVDIPRPGLVDRSRSADRGVYQECVAVDPEPGRVPGSAHPVSTRFVSSWASARNARRARRYATPAI